MIIRRLLKSCATPPVKLPDGLEMLGLPQRVFRGLAAIAFFVQLAGTLQCHADDDEQQQGCRQAEDEMASPWSRAIRSGSPRSRSR